MNSAATDSRESAILEAIAATLKRTESAIKTVRSIKQARDIQTEAAAGQTK